MESGEVLWGQHPQAWLKATLPHSRTPHYAAKKKVGRREESKVQRGENEEEKERGGEKAEQKGGSWPVDEPRRQRLEDEQAQNASGPNHGLRV